jgi:transcriptional regulator with XRE-family HTH domain
MQTVDDQEALSRIAKNLRRYRGDRSLADVARGAKTFPAAIKRIEDEENMPGAGLLTRIAEALSVGVSDLLAEPRKNSRNSA